MASNPRIPYQLSTDRPKLAGPDGKRLIVHVEVNVETWPFDQFVWRAVLPPADGKPPRPDVVNFSWFEYGMRSGLPRLIQALGSRGLAASCPLNAGVVDVYPSAADAILEAGWELMGHGVIQRPLEPETEEQVIGETLERLRSFSGQPVVGWLGPGLRETAATPDLLAAAGVRYIGDWGLDDLPCWMTTTNGPLLALPNTLDHDDALLYAVARHSSDEFWRRVEMTMRTFDEDFANGASVRVLTLGVHPHLIAVTHRMPYFLKALDALRARDDTVFMTGTEIMDWYATAVPADGGDG